MHLQMVSVAFYYSAVPLTLSQKYVLYVTDTVFAHLYI
jgi:hypothetical protein